MSELSSNETVREWMAKRLLPLSAGFLASVGLLAYPVGFLTLSLQMLVSYDLSYATIIYAVSQVPVAVVVSKLLTVLWASLFSNGLVTACVLSLWGFWNFYEHLRQIPDNPLALMSPGEIRQSMDEKGTVTLGTFNWIIQRYALLLTIPLVILDTFGAYRSWASFLMFIAFIVSGLAASYFCTPLVLRSTERDSYTELVGSFLALYLTSILAAVFLAGLSPTNLPTTEIEDGGERQTVEVLAHSDGYWHFIVGGDAVRSIPDEDVGEVNVGR